MLRVGLTGGIGSGKSEVSARLARHGAVVVDADLLAREVVEPGSEALAEIVAQFGSHVLGDDGALDRPALGAVVFADEQARRRLEAIIHPRVRARAGQLESAAGPGAVVVHDIPLLVETGQAGRFHRVVVVDAPDDLRLQRLVSGRGLKVQEAQARIDAQASRERRLEVADRVVTNDADLAALDERVAALWRDLAAEAAQRSR